MALDLIRRVNYTGNYLQEADGYRGNLSQVEALWHRAAVQPHRTASCKAARFDKARQRVHVSWRRGRNHTS